MVTDTFKPKLLCEACGSPNYAANHPVNPSLKRSELLTCSDCKHIGVRFLNPTKTLPSQVLYYA